MDTNETKYKLTILLPITLVNGLKTLATRHRRSLTGEIRWALEQYLETQEEKIATQGKDQRE